MGGTISRGSIVVQVNNTPGSYKAEEPCWERLSPFLIKQNKKPPIIKKLLSFLVNEEIKAEREGINLLKVSCMIKNGTQNPVPFPR